jgi:hypothetical protein
MDCFAWNTRGAYCYVSVTLQFVQPKAALMHYNRTGACYIGGPTTNGTIE